MHGVLVCVHPCRGRHAVTDARALSRHVAPASRFLRSLHGWRRDVILQLRRIQVARHCRVDLRIVKDRLYLLNLVPLFQVILSVDRVLCASTVELFGVIGERSE